MRDSGQNEFREGEYNVICDRCGLKYKASQTAIEWTGLRVCLPLCFETRHPQDFKRGVPDNQSVPDPRPWPEPVYITDTVEPGDL